MSLTNLLLESIPQAERAALLSEFEPVPLPLKTQLFTPEKPPKYVHLLTSGIASVVTTMSEGMGVEICLVGREGFAEGFHLLGPGAGRTLCFMQVEGTALRMDFRKFQEKFNTNEGLRRHVLRYVQYQVTILGQLAACNRLHEVEERLARWLLMVQDRVEVPVLKLTQEFLAEMLGARRSTVTLVAGSLQRSGLIDYHRGSVRILNRESLESVACECYGVTRSTLNDLYK